MDNRSGLMPKPTDYDKLQQILDKVREVKQSLTNFFLDYEREQPSWPSLLDKMTVLSSQVNNLRSSIRSLLPLLRSNSIIPMCLSPDIDPTVQQLTERRLEVFNHEFMPHLLATKNLPEIDERERLLSTNAMNISSSSNRPLTPAEVYGRVQELNATLNYITEIFAQTRQITEKIDKNYDQLRSSNPADTKKLIEAMHSGAALRPLEAPAAAPMPTAESTNVNPALAAQNPRGSTMGLRIKTTPKPNR